MIDPRFLMEFKTMPEFLLWKRIASLHLCLFLCLVFFIALLPQARAASTVTLYPIPAEVSSNHFIVSINGRKTPVLHAAVGYYLLNFDASGPATVSVTASDPHYWTAGVEVQPMRWGIRPRRKGATITFRIPGPIKLSITRPGQHFEDSEMLFLFANPPEQSGVTARMPGVRYYGPGVHRENIDAHNGDTIYLAGGAVIFGSLNLWQVHDVHVLGRGTIIYDGPQNPHSDEGWMSKPNWHVIVMYDAHDIEIDGITCITRSRTWQIQMRDSHHIGFYNAKVIGGNPSNANQDGMDWLGGGDTTVRNSFFRASDDIFALYGNWDGYELALMRIPGHPVNNITIEDSVLSTSISNIVRVGWPQKTFDSAHFHMGDVDVIHTGFGGCKVPFALFELWADPDGHGMHSDYTFQNIRLEDWYSLVQIHQPNLGVRDVKFKGVWAMDGPGKVPSVLKGDVSSVSFKGVNTGGGEATDNAALPLEVEGSAQQPTYRAAPLDARFDYTRGLLRPKREITFTALGANTGNLHYHWFFGDGSAADGRQVRHAFPDAEGTLLDGSGRFRVLLHIWDDSGHQSWSSQSVVVAMHLQPPSANPFENSATQSSRVYSRYIYVPVDGGYTFILLASTEASLAIDGLPAAHSPEPRPQVCGSPGDAVQPTRLSVALKAGWHRIKATRRAEVENAASVSGVPLLLWEGPGLTRQAIPAQPTSILHSDLNRR
jgi:hypothetical protein